MACTISTTPSQLWIAKATVLKYSGKTKLSRISCTSTNDELCMKHTQKLKDVRQLLKSEGEVPFRSLVLVDAIQRLVIDQHFQEEMEQWRGHMINGQSAVNQHEDLYQVSLYFRLMRQEGYHVPPDMFLQFKGEEGQFGRRELRKDVRGLMALYEASQLSIKGEEILDEAAYFSSHLLNQFLNQVDYNINAAVIANCLKHPYHKNLITRFKANNFILGFEGFKSWETPLNELADLEVLIAQEKHLQELEQVFKWWKNVGLAMELKDARDQPFKWYTWSMAILTDLRLSDERIDLTKSISLIYIVDDIFDLYGKPDELALFAEAVNRWELAAADQLPDYMNKCFHNLYDITNVIGYKIQLKHGSFNPVGYLHKSWARLCNAFLVEARWFASQDLPKSDDYLENGIISSGVEVVLVHLFFLLGLGAAKDCSTNLARVSGIVSSVSTILRLWDDLGSAKDEDQNGHDGSYVACYLKEHKGISVQVAREHVFQLIADEWKQLNKECLCLGRGFASFKKASLNLARMVSSMYSYDSNQRLPILKEYINSMLPSDLPDLDRHVLHVKG